MKKENQRGGARKGAGRKPTTGRVAVTRSVSMTEGQWKKLDKLRGKQSRGAYIAEQLKLKPA